MDIADIDRVVVDAEIQTETTQLLQQLIRIDTSNPPGRETEAAQFLDAYFRAEGLEGVIVGEPADRANYVLRVQGRRPGPTLALMAHLDVVPAEAERWKVPPFSGELRDGYVWGRGAADIKNLAAAWAVATRRIAASGCDFAGTLIYIAAADEEEGSVGGANQLVTNHQDLVCCDYLLNEGGGEFRWVDDRRLYEVHTGEKGTAQFKLTISGQGGHASVPIGSANAIVAAAEVVRALNAYEPRVVMDHVPPVYVETLVGEGDLARRLLDGATAREALVALGERDKSLAQLLAPLYGNTFSPTIIHSSSEAVNVYPLTVEISVDCRTVAGHDEDEVVDEVRAALAGLDVRWDLEWISAVRGNCSAYPTPMSGAIDAVIERLVPGSLVVPLHSVGFTDCNWFRTQMPDVVAYGFGPYVREDTTQVSDRYHNIDERIHVEDLGFQAQFAEQFVRELLA